MGAPQAQACWRAVGPPKHLAVLAEYFPHANHSNRATDISPATTWINQNRRCLNLESQKGHCHAARLANVVPICSAST